MRSGGTKATQLGFLLLKTSLPRDRGGRMHPANVTRARYRTLPPMRAMAEQEDSKRKGLPARGTGRSTGIAFSQRMVQGAGSSRHTRCSL